MRRRYYVDDIPTDGRYHVGAIRHPGTFNWAVARWDGNLRRVVDLFICKRDAQRDAEQRNIELAKEILRG
jgi:hypothetical protein